MGKVVGIDLGTTNSVVAVMEGGKPVVIANSEGMRTTPSVVAFSKDGERLVGQLARRQAVLNPQNTFYGFKRFMGRKYAELSGDSKRVPYTIRRDEQNNIRIKCPRLERDFAPEEISAMVLRKLADEASRYLGEPVTGAVITVPAYFNDSQRQATRDAGRIAGLEVKRILNEPTAASLAYGLERNESQTILVFDLGGGTFDVSILEVGDGVFEVKSTAGDTQLGGNDFDKQIVDWLASKFLETEEIDLRRDRQALQRLMEAAEKAKIELSGVPATEINLPFITATAEGPKHLETRLTRAEFEGLCGDLINRLRRPVKRALADAGLSQSQIDEVVLVGGSTRIPLVQQLVRSLIDLEPNQNVNPDEVVAVGAAIQAGILGGEVRDVLLLDVTPLSLGLETIGGVMKKLIPRNTTIPVRRSDIFSTAENNQTLVEVHVLQGEREMATDNKSLGRFKLTGIPPAPRGVPQIQVAFDIDANGILQVSALDRMTGREQSVVIQGASTLSEEEVNRMIQDAEEFAQTDRERRERVEKRNRIEGLILSAERQLREATLDYGIQFVSAYRPRIEALIRELRESLQRNDERGMDLAQSDLQDAIYELNREVYQRSREEGDEDDFFGSVRRAFSGDEPERSRKRNSYDDYEIDAGGASYREYSRSSWNEPGSYSNSSDRYGMDRPMADRPRADRPIADRPGSDRYGMDRPIADRPRADRPMADRPGSDRYGMDRPMADRPRADRPIADRPRADRPMADRPGSDRYGSDRPIADRPRGDRPMADRPGSDRYESDRSYRQRGRSGVNESVRYNNPYQDEDWGDEDDDWL